MSNLSDTLERFRRGGELVAVATTGAAGTELDFKPGEGKWSVRQITCHLADTEIVLAMRIRQIIAEENPVLQRFDQDKWAANLDYGRRKISQALEMLRRVRAENYDLLKDLPEASFARTGQHSVRGTEALLTVVEDYAAHLENHVRQIQAARAAYREHRAQQAAAQA